MTKILQKTTASSVRPSNYMEELTDSVLSGLLHEEKTHRFSKDNILDIKALALNRLWPMYTTSDSGREFIQRIVEEDKIEKDVIRELRAAMEKVKQHPAK